MLSAGMPVMYIILVINFAATYWIDKWLLLRLYKSPKNFDDSTINFTVSMLKISFPFHFIIGYFMLGNLNIMTSDTLRINIYLNKIQDKVHYFAIDKEVISQSHILLFCSGFLVIFCLWMLQNTILKCSNKYCNCFTKIQKAFEKMDAISDDYYDEIHLKFLIAEYERAKMDK